MERHIVVVDQTVSLFRSLRYSDRMLTQLSKKCLVVFHQLLSDIFCGESKTLCQG